LSLEYLAVTCVVIFSITTLASIEQKSFVTSDDQTLALLVDDLSSFGAPFRTDTVLVNRECKNHALGTARTLTEELLMKGGYRYRTHNIVVPVS